MTDQYKVAYDLSIGTIFNGTQIAMVTMVD